MSYKVKVGWETDGEEVDLPEIVEIPDDIQETEGGEIADYLSDTYDWLVNTIEYCERR